MLKQELVVPGPSILIDKSERCFMNCTHKVSPLPLLLYADWGESIIQVRSYFVSIILIQYDLFPTSH